MSDEKIEQVKLVMVFVLALVLGLVVYIRFQHKEGKATTSEAARPDRSVSLKVPEISLEEPVKTGRLLVPVGPPVREPLRDIFAPGPSSSERAGGGPGDEESVSIASLKLRGVVAGGVRPLALINDRFVRPGDRLYQYRVVSIGAKGVWLVSGTETFQLNVLEDKKDKRDN